jgi:hypothetical protein
MIVHVVLMRFPDARDAEEAARRLRTLSDKVDVIRRFDVGSNVVPSERAYDLGLVMEFDSIQDLETYQMHPEHGAVAEFCAARREAAVSCDFER